MNYGDIIKKSVLEGFSYSDFPTAKIMVTLGITFLLAVYLFFIYRMVTGNTFYDRDFNITAAMVSVVTAGIVIAMQSNFVISLGMVGALSIVRFRTAIKNPKDLLFLFWSVGTGVVCGAGLYELAVILAAAVTLGMFALQLVPLTASPMLLIIKMDGIAREEAVLSVIKGAAKRYRVDSKSITDGRENLIVEIRAKEYGSLADDVSKVEGVLHVTLMRQEGEIRNGK